MLRQRGVETVIPAGADAHGIMRGKRVPIAELDRAAEQGVALCDVVRALPVVEHCVAMRRDELAAQAPSDTDWETARYLEAL